MSFSNAAWTAITPIYRGILALPLITEFAAGTLSEERFRFYLLQDTLYLVAFARTLSIAAARSPDKNDLVQFAASEREAIIVERTLHETYLRKFGIEREHVERTEPSPTCAGYANFLLATACLASYEVLIAAVLPCFWIYWEVGKDLRSRSAPANPYRTWINTYADESFAQAVQAVIAIADRVAERTAGDACEQMIGAFRRASQFEWMFWDSAYRLENWAVG